MPFRKPLPKQLLRQAGSRVCAVPPYCHPRGGPWGHVLPDVGEGMPPHRPGAAQPRRLPSSPQALLQLALPCSPARGPADGGSLVLSSASVPAQWPGLCHGACELPEEHPAAPKPTSSSAPTPSRHCFIPSEAGAQGAPAEAARSQAGLLPSAP